MRKYKQLKHAVQLQKQLDRKYGTSRFHAALIIALFFCLFFTSCSSSQAASSSSSSQTSNSTNSSQSTNGNANVTITNSGQSTSVNLMTPPNDNLHRIHNVYFAKKRVVGTEVSFDVTDSAHPQRDGQNNIITYDSILGKTVYLVLETQNLTPNEQIRVEIQSESLTGNTNALEVMYFNASRQYTSAQTLTAVVGNFDALNNNTGSCPYTNLADHSHRAIIKLQLRPSTRAIFDEWATRLGNANGTVQVRVQRNRGNCAYGNSNRETSDGSTFLSAAEQQFRVVNRSFYEIYAPVFTQRVNNRKNYNANPYNFLANNRKMAYLKNNNSTKVAYIYHDPYDNEFILTTCEKTQVMGRNIGIILDHIPVGYSRSAPAPAGGHAENNYYYPNEDIVTDGHFIEPNSDPPQRRKVRYSTTGNEVDLVRMPDGLNINLGNNILIAFNFTDTQRRYCSPECFAGFMGVLGQFGIAGVRCTGMCFGDATCYPSISHNNGVSVDTGYLTRNINRPNNTNQQDLLYAFVDWGFTQVIAAKNRRNWLLGANRYNKAHNDHLHAGIFDSNSMETII